MLNSNDDASAPSSADSAAGSSLFSERSKSSSIFSKLSDVSESPTAVSEAAGVSSTDVSSDTGNCAVSSSSSIFKAALGFGKSSDSSETEDASESREISSERESKADKSMSGIVISGMVRSSWSVSSAGTSSCSSNVSTSSGTVSSVSVRSFTFIGSGLKSKEESISSKLNGSSSAPDEAASSCGSSESSPALESSGASFGIFSSDSPSSKSGLLNWPKPSKTSVSALTSLSSKSVSKSKEPTSSTGICSEDSESAVSDAPASFLDISSKLKEERNVSMSEVSGIPSSSTGYASPETISGSSDLVLGRSDWEYSAIPVLSV